MSNITNSNQAFGLASPADGATWPAKGLAIANWMITGIEMWRAIDEENNGVPASDSCGHGDALTIHSTIRLGEIGQVVRFLVGGATEMFRGLASMYNNHDSFPLIRAHLPLVRSLQEHCGRVIWLLEPGAEIGALSPTPIYDAVADAEAFQERALRLKMLHDELLDDRLAAARKRQDQVSIDLAVSDGGCSTRLRRASRTAAGEIFPGYSGFAEICENRLQKLHLLSPQLTTVPYGRISETSHGTLLGLFGDTVATGQTTRRFIVDERSLEAVAARAGLWWQTAVGIQCSYFGWPWEELSQPFDGAYASLFRQ
jgi:hypothetical protein